MTTSRLSFHDAPKASLWSGGLPVMSLASYQQALGMLLLLNLFDAMATLRWIQAGHATEANPVMAGALNMGTGYFLAAKVLLVGLGVALLWKQSALRFARLALIPALLLYVAVAGAHVAFALHSSSIS